MYVCIHLYLSTDTEEEWYRFVYLMTLYLYPTDCSVSVHSALLVFKDL